jgi:arylsulfatase A-like enzyme/thioredoxin-like negative regulator of GroEL
MTVIRGLLCVVCLAASALAATAAPPNVILITVDTTRADRMGFLGSKLGLTPNLDVLARDSVVFTRAYSQAPLTAPSHATILTGTYPQFHRVNNFGVQLANDLTYAPAILKARGYHTAAFVGAIALDPKAGLAPGFDRGFDTYDAGFGHAPRGADRYHSIERRGGEVVAHALAWLNRHPQGPFFLWVHLYDPHDPYDPPEPYKSKYAVAPYDGEIAYADFAVGKLLSYLRARGLYNTACIAVMSDHGEALGDHGEATHGFFLYDETIHVPLVIKLPRKNSAVQRSWGKRIEARVELVDVLPTILQVVGITAPQEIQGQNLLSLIKAAPAVNPEPGQMLQERQAYAETDYGQEAYGWSSLRALRAGKYLYVQAPRKELYDQPADPKAEHDLSATSTAVISTLAGQLDAFRQKTASSRVASKSAVDPDAREKLAALGYVASSSNDLRANANEQGADPKDKIEIANLIHQANMLRENGRFVEAVPVLQQLIAKEPAMESLYAKLGQCLMFMQDYQQAVRVMRKLVDLSPNSADAHFQLGGALVAAQDFAAALPELENAVAKVPHWDRARLMLANAYIHTNRVPEAIKEYNQILEVTPDDYLANLLLGRVLVLSGDPAAALPKLKKAETLQPKAPEPHLVLSNAYLKLGRYDDAAREQFEAQQLGPDHAE